MGIAENLSTVQAKIPIGVKLVAVSKTKSNESIMQAYAAGQRDFGENKPQELMAKQKDLPRDINWHMIGHLQTNKVKYIAPFVSLVHAVDSLKLLTTLNLEAQKNNRVITYLLQIHIAQEETKFGFDYKEIVSLIRSEEYKSFYNVRLGGVMGMATFTDDSELVRSEFRYLKDCFLNLKNDFFKEDDEFKDISMGMSDDYIIAIEEGSTMVRIGSSIFGVR
ncbi:MAG: YggS family pyridoxal phosphate-dependent enzyme [Bacteroidales bacterium]|nr:YggS family pyridoxal phosphate-dependent enzyme [Bacteroidales bacterium]MCF8456569.1 YggS family pyridoxal phosphate-dependent enzyme [Bacteroidales bacterium]